MAVGFATVACKAFGSSAGVGDSIDLSIRMLPVKSSSLELGLVKFTITTTNNSSVDATSVEVADTLGTSLSYLYHSTSAGKYDPASGIWSIGTLGAGSSRMLSIDARIDSGTIGSRVENVAGVLSLDQSDPNLSNNFAVATVNVLGPSAPSEQEPTYDPVVDRMVWSDSFDRYASAAAMDDANAQALYGLRTGEMFGYSAVHQTLVSPGRNGIGKALRGIILNDPAHAQQSVNWTSPKGSPIAGQLPLVYPLSSETMIFQFWFRISPGGSPAPYGTKWFEWWPASGGHRTQAGLYVNGPSKDYLGRTTHLRFHVQSDRGEVAYQPVGPFVDLDLNDGTWHRFTAAYRANTVDNYPNPGSRDGLVRVWLDGTKVVDLSATAASITPPHGDKVWCQLADVDKIWHDDIRYSLFPAVFNGTDVGFTLDHDDLTWWVENGP
jgi:uncharacterized repeat protein (TIGR01451 family)